MKTLGSSLLTLTLLKYILLATFVISTYFTGRTIFQRPTSSTLVIVSLLLMPIYAHKVHVGFSHTILLLNAISCTFLTYCLVIKNNKPLHFALFGLAIAMGIYSKYNYIIFISALFFTTLSLKELRLKFFNQRLLISIFVVLVLTLPLIGWWLSNYQEALQAIAEKGNKSNSLSHLIAQNLLECTLFVTPFIWLFIPEKSTLITPHASDNHIYLNLFKRAHLILLLLFLICMAVGIGFKQRYLFPFFYLLPFWIFLKLDVSGYSHAFLKRFFTWSAIATILIVFIRLIQIKFVAFFISTSRLSLPIMPTFKKIPEHIIADSNIIITDHQLYANTLMTVPPSQLLYNATPHVYTHKKNCFILTSSQGDSSTISSQHDYAFTEPYGRFYFTLYLDKTHESECASFFSQSDVAS
ncbi:MAG: ArnT family glycosyltransferase [Candidatus Comchoanobacterales bacterium]